MYNSGLFKRCKHGVKLLGRGVEELKELGLPLNFEVSDAS